MPDIGRCRSCGATIRWTPAAPPPQTDVGRELIPLDVDSDPPARWAPGLYTIAAHATAMPWLKGAPRPPGTIYSSHFKTCPARARLYGASPPPAA